MSQEINLLNPALRVRRDFLGFESVATATLAAFLLIAASYAFAALRADGAKRANEAVTAQLRAAQQSLTTAQAALAAKKSDPALEQEALRLGEAVKHSRETLRRVTESASNADPVSEVMRGFSRQIVEGVWLTGFTLGPAGMEIRGRLLDPGLLPGYIKRLNGEPAFRGRRFAALDMRAGVSESPAAASAAGAAPATPAVPPRYTDFALQASLPQASSSGERR